MRPPRVVGADDEQRTRGGGSPSFRRRRNGRTPCFGSSSSGLLADHGIGLHPPPSGHFFRSGDSRGRPRTLVICCPPSSGAMKLPHDEAHSAAPEKNLGQPRSSGRSSRLSLQLSLQMICSPPGVPRPLRGRRHHPRRRQRGARFRGLRVSLTESKSVGVSGSRAHRAPQCECVRPGRLSGTRRPSAALRRARPRVAVENELTRNPVARRGSRDAA